MSDRKQLISASPHAALVAIVGSLAGNVAEAQVPPPYPQSQPVQPQQMQMQQQMQQGAAPPPRSCHARALKAR